MRSTWVEHGEITDFVEDYINGRDWRVRENANMGFSLQGLNHHVQSQIMSRYWLERVYPEKVARYHDEGIFHIHDLGHLSSYCVGWDLLDLLKRGFGGVEGKTASNPPKHFSTALLQVVNFMYTLQGEVAGAVAFSNFDTLLAPFIRYDGLTYKEVKQLMQEFIFNMNVPTRVGFQAPFSNLTFDLKVPAIFADRQVIVGGREMEETYREFQKEMDMINLAFVEVMMEGDASNRPFSFPIPTYNITSDFDWNGEVVRKIMELTAKYGTPYFANYLNTDMKPDDARSMCCRLRLDNRKVKQHMEKLMFKFSGETDDGSSRRHVNRRGGIFASHPLTGSIGVVTVNMPRLMYLSKGDEERFLFLLRDAMETAKESLEVKRYWVERFTNMGLYPYSRVYLEPVKEISGRYWSNHFSTIGLVGMHEALLNFGVEGGLLSKRGKSFALRVLKYMVDTVECFIEETGNLYNIEATPAESASYRLARLDKSRFPDIITAGTDEVPYYTNSTLPPAGFTHDPFELAEHQEDFQALYTGGTVVHFFVGEKIEDPEALRIFLKRLSEDFSLPYITVTPTYSVCSAHGYIAGEVRKCPVCGRETEVYSRIVGYYRPVQAWNDGKKQEFRDRRTVMIE